MFIDTHAHLNFKTFKDDYREVIKRAFDNNVKGIINVGSSFSTSLEATRIAHELSQNTNKHESTDRQLLEAEDCELITDSSVYAAVGLHPIHLVKDIVEEATFDGNKYSFKTKQEFFDYQKYKNLAKSSKKVIAIGETGIDLYRLEDSNYLFNDIIKLQSGVFRDHVRLAKELNLPLIIHSRDDQDHKYSAYKIMLEILKKEKYYRGVIHCFVGNLKEAKEFIKMGFYIGVNGIVTFKNSVDLQAVIKKIPIDKILVETDCPYLAPEPHRGKRNEPASVVEVAKKIVEIKNIPLFEVENQTTKNAINLFKLEDLY
jgi:TatD DNase family protein